MTDRLSQDASFAGAHETGGEAMGVAATNQSNEPVPKGADMDAETTGANPETELAAASEGNLATGEEEVAARLGDFA